jgi:WD40 repeat protein
MAAGPDGTGPTLAVWSVADGKLAAQIDLAGRPPLCAAPTPDGKRVAVGGADDAIRVYDVATGALRRTFTGHRGAVLCLAVSPDGRRLLSGSIDTTALVWALP